MAQIDLSAFPCAQTLRSARVSPRIPVPVRFHTTVNAGVRTPVTETLRRILLVHNTGRSEAIHKGFLPLTFLALLEERGYRVERFTEGVRISWYPPSSYRKTDSTSYTDDWEVEDDWLAEWCEAEEYY